MKENPPITLVDWETAKKIEDGTLPVRPLYRDVLAERLGVAPKERLTMTVVLIGQAVAVSVLLDGGDLTPDQDKIFREFLQECPGIEKVLGPTIPERPTTS
jgi:hypothetical protein